MKRLMGVIAFSVLMLYAVACPLDEEAPPDYAGDTRPPTRGESDA